jgi:hypothetical protein
MKLYRKSKKLFRFFQGILRKIILETILLIQWRPCSNSYPVPAINSYYRDDNVRQLFFS